MKAITRRLLLAFAKLLPLGATAQEKKLKVYILAGQSNMQGHVKVSTFEHIGMDPATAPLLTAMTGPDGKPKVCQRVWISALGCGQDEREEKTGQLTAGFGASPEKIGPEFTFGLTMERLTGAPVLLIKTAWGGKSLHTDFRPPSAGPYVFNESELASFQKQGKNLAAAGKLPPAEENAAHQELRAERLTARERKILEAGISNLEFHYLARPRSSAASAWASRRRWRNWANTDAAIPEEVLRQAGLSEREALLEFDRHLGRVALARHSDGPRGGPPFSVQQQPETNRAGSAEP